MTDFNGNLVLVRGVSGAGKSLIASLLQGEDMYLSIATDDMFYDDDGNYNFDPSKLGKYHNDTLNIVGDAMSSTQDSPQKCNRIIVHNTFTAEWQLQPYLDLAKEHNWRVSTIIVENRHGSESIHNVPAHSIDKQKKELSDNIIL